MGITIIQNPGMILHRSTIRQHDTGRGVDAGDERHTRSARASTGCWLPVRSWSSGSRRRSPTMGPSSRCRGCVYAAPPRPRSWGMVCPFRSVCRRPGQQGDPARRHALPLRSGALPDHHRRAAHREPHHRGVTRASLSARVAHARPDPRGLGAGRGRAARAAQPVRRAGHRREPAGRRTCSRRHGAAGAARGCPERRAHAGAADHAGDRRTGSLLGAQGGRLRQLAMLGGDAHRIAAARRAAAAGLRQAAADRGRWRASWA